MRKILHIFRKAYIIFLCSKYFIKNYTINDDLSIDIKGDLMLNGFNINKLPIKLNKIIDGTIYCNYCKLTSFKNFPKEVSGFIQINNNKLTSFEGMPTLIYKDTVNSFISCEKNKIKSFKGIPEDFVDFIFCKGNPIYEIYKLFNDNSKCVYWINEYDVIQGDNIILDRLEEVFIQLEMEVPTITHIEGYNLI